MQNMMGNSQDLRFSFFLSMILNLPFKIIDISILVFGDVLDSIKVMIVTINSVRILDQLLLK